MGLVFRLFGETGSAFGVMQRFAESALPFPKRSYGGAWDGKILWGHLTHSRVLSMLKNPCYAGMYVFGRYRYRREINAEGVIQKRIHAVAMADWRVSLKEHHEGYITLEEFFKNQERFKEFSEPTASKPCWPARRAKAWPYYKDCYCVAPVAAPLRCAIPATAAFIPATSATGYVAMVWRARTAWASVVICWIYDAIAEEVLKALQPAEIELALAALEELESRDQTISRQWQMRLERAEYEAALAERRYQEVDPSQRLVAGTLERRWNDALLQLEDLKKQAAESQRQEARVTTDEQRAKVLALATDLPSLWHAPTTQAKDRKRMLRLLIKDITVEKATNPKRLLVHIRWQGGACNDVCVQLPRNIADRVRYSAAVVDHVRHLAQSLSDGEIADRLNQEKHVSALGKAFTGSMVQWIRYRYEIAKARLARPEELTVQQVAERFRVSPNVVYYWIDRGVIKARRLNAGSPYWITLNEPDDQKLQDWVRNSCRIQSVSSTRPEECAL